MEDFIKNAIQQELNCQEVNYFAISDEPYYIAHGKSHLYIHFENELTASNFVVLLKALPKFMADQDSLSNIVKELIGLVALQQSQIQELNDKLEHAVHARVAIQAQQTAYDSIQNLVDAGTSIGRQELHLKVRAIAESTRKLAADSQLDCASSTQMASQHKGSRQDFKESSRAFTAEAKGLLKALAGLHVTGNSNENAIDASEHDSRHLEKSEVRVQNLESVQIQSRVRTDFEGSLHLVFEDVISNPMARSETAGRASVNSSEKALKLNRSRKPRAGC